MESWELLRQATDPVGVKAVAAKLNVSAALIYKWCQPPASGEEGGSGARNPLDRMRMLYEATRDPRLINWLCHLGGGFYVPNPTGNCVERGEQLLGTTQRMVQDFGELLGDISRSIENDGLITAAEAGTIRASWERLKAQTECFVIACERGVFAEPGTR